MAKLQQSVTQSAWKSPSFSSSKFQVKKVPLISTVPALPGNMSGEKLKCWSCDRWGESIFSCRKPQRLRMPARSLQLLGVLTLSSCRLTANSAIWQLQLQLSLLSVFSWISWIGSYDITKIQPHITSFLYIHFGFENMSLALNIGKNAKPENLFFPRPNGYSGLENGQVTWVRGNPGL